MWMILTIVFAVATYVAVLLFDSMIPAFIFLLLALAFAAVTWNKRSSNRRK